MIIQLDDRDEVELESGDLESESTDSETDSESESEDVSAEGLISEVCVFPSNSNITPIISYSAHTLSDLLIRRETQPNEHRTLGLVNSTTWTMTSK